MLFFPRLYRRGRKASGYKKQNVGQKKRYTTSPFYISLRPLCFSGGLSGSITKEGHNDSQAEKNSYQDNRGGGTADSGGAAAI